VRSRSLFGFDVYVLAATLALMVIGVLFIYSSGVTATGIVFSNEYIKQIVWAGCGLLLLLGMAFIDYARLQRWSWWIYGSCLLLLLITLQFGRVVNGARSWLGIWELGIQPSEFMKVACIIALARYFSANGRRVGELPTFLVGLLIVLVPMALVLLQPDMGTAIVYLPIFLVVVFVAGGRIRHVLFVMLAVAVMIVFTLVPAWHRQVGDPTSPIVTLLSGRHLLLYTSGTLALVGGLAVWGLVSLRRAYFYWIFYTSGVLVVGLLGALAASFVLKDYQLMRLIVFLDPEVDPKGAGWNIIQSVTAVGSGGLWGKGFLQGTQSHYRFLPQQSTDFIFSIISEEWGLWGGLLVFVLFLIIILRGLYISSTARDSFGSYTGAGIVGMIFFHVIVNIGMAMGIMPVTGIPLFFLSYGGSSLWTALVSIGILLSIYLRRYRY
jgi:rod shape determining protein RodA